MIKTFTKDPNDCLWYGFDWTLDAGVDLTGSTWLIEEKPASDADAPLTVEATAFADQRATVKLSGGVLGRYVVTCRGTWGGESPAEQADQSFALIVQNSYPI